MTTHHAVLWIDHNEARALALDGEGTDFHELAHLRSEDTHTHPKKLDGHRHPLDAHFLAKVEALIAQCDFVVLVGPSGTKDEVVAHLDHIGSPHRARIVSVHTHDRISDGELAAHARVTFRAADRMKGIHVGT